MNKSSSQIIAAKLQKKLIQNPNSKIKKLNIQSIELDQFENFKYQQYFSREELSSNPKTISLAGRYVTKLALASLITEPVKLNSIKLIRTASGQPIIKTTNPKLQKSLSKISISLTHEDNQILGIAILSTQKAIPVGIDIVKNSRIKNLITDCSAALPKILTTKEQESFQKNSTKIAIAWSAKEAISKALGIGIWHGGLLQDIEINLKPRSPQVTLTNKMQSIKQKLGIKNITLEYVATQNFTCSMCLGV